MTSLQERGPREIAVKILERIIEFRFELLAIGLVILANLTPSIFTDNAVWWYDFGSGVTYIILLVWIMFLYRKTLWKAAIILIGVIFAVKDVLDVLITRNYGNTQLTEILTFGAVLVVIIIFSAIKKW